MQFKQMMHLQGWTKEMAAERMVFYLKGAALTCYTLIPEHEQGDLDKVVQALSQRFGKVVTAETQRTRFYTLSQGDNESLIEFSDRVKAMARDAFSPEEVSSSYAAKEMVRTFLRGLKDAELTRYGAILELKDIGELLSKLLIYRETTHRPLTRPKLRSVTFKDDDSDSEEERGKIRQVNRAYSYQSSKVVEPSSTPIAGQSPTSALQQVEAGQNKLLASMGEIKVLLQGLTKMWQSVPTEDTRPRCFGCQEIGHYKRECPLLSRSPSPRGRSGPSQSPQRRFRSPSPLNRNRVGLNNQEGE